MKKPLAFFQALFKSIFGTFRRLSLKAFALVLVSLLVLVSSGTLFVEAAVPPLQVGATRSLSGVFWAIFGDPGPNTSKLTETLYFLTDDAGQTYNLQINPKNSTSPNGVMGMVKKRVKLNGTVASVAVGSANPTLVVQSVQIDTTPGLRPVPGVATLGSNPFISIMCRYSDNPAQPQNQAYFATQLNNTKPGFDNYIREMSYGRYDLIGSTAAGWFALPQTRSYYIGLTGGPNVYLKKLAEDCTAAANAGGVNFATPTQYYGINFMFNDAIDGSAWGGGYPLVLNGVDKNWSMTWMPYSGAFSTFGWAEHGILAHEISHAFSSPHSGSTVSYQYGSSWDVVSNPQAHCGDVAGVVDPNYGCVGQHVVAVNKDAMQFIPPGRKYTYTIGSGSQTVTLERVAQPPTTTSILMAQIPISAAAGTYYTVETRFRIGYDIKLPNADGVIIHQIDPTRVDATGAELPAILVAPPGVADDALRGPAGGPVGVGDKNALWPVGTTFTDLPNNIRIRIDSVSAVNGTAVITINPPALPPIDVTNPSDTGPGSIGTVGTLSYALTNVVNGQSVTFNLTSGTTVQASGTLPIPPLGSIIDGGSCTAGPRITIQGTGANTAAGVKGLVLNKGVSVKNIQVTGFGGQQIFVTGGNDAATMKCVVAKK